MALIILSGSIGCSGAPILGNADIAIAGNVDHTLSVAESTNLFLRVTSDGTSTGIRKVIAPAVKGTTYEVQNATSEGFAISVIAASGTGATIATGSSAICFFDGPNYVLLSGGSISLAGDVTGTTAASVVAKVNGASVPAAGALTTGNGAYVSGASSLAYSALNLAGGGGWVTGVLPAANQAAQTMGGDATGTTASNAVVQISGTGATDYGVAGTKVTATTTQVRTAGGTSFTCDAVNTGVALSSVAATFSTICTIQTANNTAFDFATTFFAADFFASSQTQITGNTQRMSVQFTVSVTNAGVIVMTAQNGTASSSGTLALTPQNITSNVGGVAGNTTTFVVQARVSGSQVIVEVKPGVANTLYKLNVIEQILNRLF
jgi:hypothetical protein